VYGVIVKVGKRSSFKAYETSQNKLTDYSKFFVMCNIYFR